MRILVLSKSIDKSVFEGLRPLIDPYFCESVMAATALSEEIKPRFVFIEIDMRGSVDFLKWLKRETGSTVILMTAKGKAMDYGSLGADLTIVAPVMSDDISDVLSHLGFSKDKLLIDPDGNDPGHKDETSGFWDIGELFDEPEAQALSHTDKGDGHIQVVAQEVVSVWGANGGAGRTTLAIRLAEALSDFDVLLVDLCFCEGPGDVNAVLGLPPAPHIGRLIDERQDRRKGFVECLLKPKGAGFGVIQPPPTIDQAENITPDDIVELIDQARRMFQIVIIDLPNDLSPITLEAIDMSTSVLLTTNNHNGGMARLETLKSFIRKDISKQLVLNRFDKSKTRAKDIAHFLDLPLAGVIGEINNFEEYVNKGKILKLPHNVTDSAINDILKSIFGFDRPSAKKKIFRNSFLQAKPMKTERMEARREW